MNIWNANEKHKISILVAGIPYTEKCSRLYAVTFYAQYISIKINGLSG
jgi:hypothetical protein